jgi:mycothiol system anti-sigma-R factor
MIDCREAVRRMWAYLDHALGETPVDEFEAHLETCQRCCGELEFSRHLRAMVAATDATPTMPPELRTRVELLLADAETPGQGRP